MQTTSNHSLARGTHASMSSGLGDIARIVLQQMQLEDGPCKYWMRHAEIWRNDEKFVDGTVIS